MGEDPSSPGAPELDRAVRITIWRSHRSPQSTRFALRVIALVATTDVADSAFADPGLVQMSGVLS